MMTFSPSPAADLRVAPFTFAATEITVEALTPAGREFLAGIAGTCAGVAPASVTIAKSCGDELAARAARKGLRVSA
jgi:hypothetical protein